MTYKRIKERKYFFVGRWVYDDYGKVMQRKKLRIYTNGELERILEKRELLFRICKQNKKS